MKIFDAHMHLNGGAAPAPKELLKKFEEVDVIGACLFSIDPEDPSFTFKERMDNLFKWCDGYEGILYPVAWIHPLEDDVMNKVREAAKRGVAAFKFIPDVYHVNDEQPTKVFRLIEELGLPIFFHTGMCYDFHESAQYCNPVDWECFVKYRNIRVSIAHAGFPWCDEALHLFSKYYYNGRKLQRAVKGTETTYLNYPWIKEHMITNENGEPDYVMPELYLDTTPGPSGTFRENLFKNLVSWCPNNRRVFFGSDYYADDYQLKYVAPALQRERDLMKRLEVPANMVEDMFQNNIKRFLGLVPRISDIEN